MRQEGTGERVEVLQMSPNGVKSFKRDLCFIICQRNHNGEKPLLKN